MDSDTPSHWSRLTDPSVLLGLLTFLTLVATHLLTTMTDRRNRRWAREDLKAAAEEARQAALVTHLKLDENTALTAGLLSATPTIVVVEPDKLKHGEDE